MPSAISGFTPTTPPSTGSSASLNTMTGGDFLKLMIQQLQQQDPMNPTDSSQLLTQMSQISNLQSNAAMVTSLSSLTLQQSIGSAGNLIGKSINGIDDNGNQLQGVVTSIKVVNKKVRLELDGGNDLAMENVTQIAGTGKSTLSNLASAIPQLQQILGTSTTTPATAAVKIPGTATGTTNSNNSAIANLLAALGVK
jgi:flagellar basal-body rod modification protein FlgD